MTSAKKTDSSTDGDAKKSKLSWWQRMNDAKRGPPISDEDLEKYIGLTRKELKQWAESQPGIGKNQLAGKLALGPASGFGGASTAFGYGGWGPSAEPTDMNRGMKFPPPPAPTKVEDNTDDESIADGKK